MDKKAVHIIGGGTVSYIGSHLATCAPAYGSTARMLHGLCCNWFDTMDVRIHLTKMACGGAGNLETNDDIQRLIDQLVLDDKTKIIFMNAALVDFGQKGFRKYGERYSTKERNGVLVNLDALPKVVTSIRKHRKDIFLVAFKQTCGLTEDEQYIAGLGLCKGASCNLVLANDTKTRLNMIITPEEARYHVTTDRMEALTNLVQMAKARSHLTFTRSTVIDHQLVSWDSELVYPSLRKVVDFCIEQGAYKPFNGSTAGHFACKLTDDTFLTSIRKTNFNDLKTKGLVKVVTDGPDSVMAYGAKPSVGGQSQRIVFNDHRDYDCIVHFHCPIKEGSQVPVASQREFECGSHECGRNTSNNLKVFGNLSAVYLDQHGPNIVFHHSIDPQEVIDFIKANFDLDHKTGGFVSVFHEGQSTLDAAKQLL